MKSSDNIDAMFLGIYAEIKVKHPKTPTGEDAIWHMRLLSDREEEVCYVRALQEFEKLTPFEKQIPFKLEKLKCAYMIDRALSEPPTKSDLFFSLSKNYERKPINLDSGESVMLEEYSADFILKLFNKWEQACRECTPNLDSMSEEEFFILVEDIKKKPEIIYGGNLSYRTLQNLTSFFYQKIATYSEEVNALS
jgi:hypothetical protein